MKTWGKITLALFKDGVLEGFGVEHDIIYITFVDMFEKKSVPIREILIYYVLCCN